MSGPIDQERLSYFLRGHQPAMDFVTTIVNIFHIYDDLIDHDRVVSDDEIHATFWHALVVLPTNTFYVQHFPVLHPMILNAILNWRAATALERDGDEKDRTMAFMLRSTYHDLVSMSALLVGGVEWAVQVGPALRRWACGETYAEYLVHLRRESEARHGDM